jgi:hypothetical protein
VLKDENKSEMIIKLLEEKNNHLEMFLNVSEKERKSFKARNFDNLELLYQIREDILENIRCIDERVDGYSHTMDNSLLGEAEKSRIVNCLRKKETLTHMILEQDLVILSCVENEKSAIIRKMSTMRDGRRLMKAYRQLPDIVD